jgi:hypothetical protein
MLFIFFFSLIKNLQKKNECYTSNHIPIMSHIEFISEIWINRETPLWFKPGTSIAKNEIYSAYKNFCKQKQIPKTEEFSNQQFWQHLNHVICNPSNKKKKIGDSTKKLFYINLFSKNQILKNINKCKRSETKSLGKADGGSSRQSLDDVVTLRPSSKKGKQKTSYLQSENNDIDPKYDGRKATTSSRLCLDDLQRNSESNKDSIDIDEAEVEENGINTNKLENRTTFEAEEHVAKRSAERSAARKKKGQKRKRNEESIEEIPKKKQKLFSGRASTVLALQRKKEVIGNKDFILSKAVEGHALPAVEDFSNKSGEISACEINRDYNAMASSQINIEKKKRLCAHKKKNDIDNTKKDDPQSDENNHENNKVNRIVKEVNELAKEVNQFINKVNQLVKEVGQLV